MLDLECDHQFVVFLSLASDKGTVFIWMETGYLSYLEIFIFAQCKSIILFTTVSVSLLGVQNMFRAWAVVFITSYLGHLKHY